MFESRSGHHRTVAKLAAAPGLNPGGTAARLPCKFDSCLSDQHASVLSSVDRAASFYLAGRAFDSTQGGPNIQVMQLRGRAFGS